MFSSAGIILAGGHSRRMGRDKALLPLPGSQTFVGYLTNLLTALCSEVVLVVRDEKQAAEYTPYTTARIVTDRVANIGPLMGLYSGLSAIQASHALVTAVDMPFVQPNMLTFLLSQALDDTLLIPLVDDVYQVLLAVYPRTILPLLEELLRAGRRDPHSLLHVAQVRTLGEVQLRRVDPQLRSFVNVNTPEDITTS